MKSRIGIAMVMVLSVACGSTEAVPFVPLEGTWSLLSQEPVGSLGANAVYDTDVYVIGGGRWTRTYSGHTEPTGQKFGASEAGTYSTTANRTIIFEQSSPTVVITQGTQTESGVMTIGTNAYIHRYRKVM